MATAVASILTRAKVEEVSCRIVPTAGISIDKALRDADPTGVESIEVNENEALITVFKNKPKPLPIEYVDNVLWFRVAVSKGSRSITINLDDGLVFGLIKTLAVYDLNERREWIRLSDEKGLDLSGGGVLQFNLD